MFFLPSFIFILNFLLLASQSNGCERIEIDEVTKDRNITILL